MHMPRFWKHKETKEVIDHLTYSDLKEPHSLDFQECDVTGALLNKEAVETPIEERTINYAENTPESFNGNAGENLEGNTENNDNGSITTP